MNYPPCPSGPSWDALIKAVGDLEARRDYLEHKGVIRTPEEVKSKLASLGKIIMYQGTSSDVAKRLFNYYTESEAEAKDYGSNVSTAVIDTEGYLTKKSDPEKYYSEVDTFQKESGYRFDILDNSPEGLNIQDKFFSYLRDKGYKGIDLRGGED